jgi:inactivated superfamily I helicase
MHGDVHNAVAISGDPWIADDRDTPDRILAARIINTCVRLGVLADESAGA